MERGGGLYHHDLGIPMREVTVCAAVVAMAMEERVHNVHTDGLPRHRGKKDDRGEVRFPAQHTSMSRPFHVLIPPL
jgi:hypothetical protein